MKSSSRDGGHGQGRAGAVADAAYFASEVAHLRWVVTDLWNVRSAPELGVDPSRLIVLYQWRLSLAEQRLRKARRQLGLEGSPPAPHTGAAAPPVPAFAWTVAFPSAPPPPAPASTPLPPSPLPPSPLLPTSPLSPLPPQPPAPPRPRRPARPPFDWRAFFADNSLAILSYSGAFLLLVAALLFELYGGLSSGGRLVVLAALHAGFVVVGLGFQRRRDLAMVGKTYVATGALLAPVLWLAAAALLGLGRDLGSASAALALAGGYCALLYAVLAVRLQAGEYAVLSVAAMAAGLGGVCGAAGAPAWSGAATAWLSVGVLGFLRRPWKSLDFARVYLEPTAWAGCLIGVAGSIVVAGVDLSASSVSAPVALYLPVAILAVLGAIWLPHHARTELRVAASWAVLVAAACTTAMSFQAGRPVLALCLAVGALGTVGIRRLSGAPGQYDHISWLLVGCAMAAVLLDGGGEPVRSVVMAVVIGAGSLTALATRRIEWNLAGLAALLGVGLVVLLQSPPPVRDLPTTIFLPLGAGLLTAGMAASVVRLGRWDALALVFASAVAAALLADFALGATGGVYIATLVGAALVCRVGALVAQRSRRPGVLASLGGSSWSTGAEIDAVGAVAWLVAALIPSGMPDAVGLVVGTGAMLCMAWRALESRDSRWLVAGLAVIAARVGFVAVAFPAQLTGAAGPLRLTVLPVGLFLAAVCGLACLRRSPRAGLFEAVTVACSATAMATAYTFGAGFEVAAIVLAVCGYGWALAAIPLDRPAWRRWLLAGGSVQTFVATLFPTAVAVRMSLVAVAVALASIRAILERRPWVLALALPSLAVPIVVALSSGDPAAAPELKLLPIPIAVLCAGTAACAVVLRRRDLIAALSLELSAIALLSCNALGASAQVYAVVLAACGYVWALAAIPLDRTVWRRWLLAGGSVQTFVATLVPTTVAVRMSVVAVAVALATIRAISERRPWMLALALPSLAVPIGVALSSGASATAPELQLLPIPIAVLFAGTAVCARVLRRRDLIAALLVELSAITLLSCNSLGAPTQVYRVALVLLGLVAAGAAEAMDRGRFEVRLFALAQLAVTPLLITDPPAAMTATLLAATAGATWLTVRERARRVAVEVVAILLGLCTWWWGSVAITHNTDLGGGHLGRVYAVLPWLLLPACLWLSRRTAAREAAALLACAAGGIAVACITATWAVGDEVVAGLLMVVDGLGLFVAGAALPALRGPILGASGLVAIGGVLVAHGTGVETAALPLVSLGVAWASALVSLFLPIAARCRREQRGAAVLVAAITVAGCMSSPTYTTLGGAGAWIAALATLSVAGLLALSSVCDRLPRLGYAAVLTASAAVCWAALAMGAVRPEAYTALPAATLIGCALMVRQDRRLDPPANIDRMAMLAGMLLLLGVPAVSGLLEYGDTSVSLLLLVAFGVGAIVTGVGFRDRMLVIGGAAGLLGAAAKSVFVAVQQVPLYVAFGATALLLLAMATSLALARERLAWARGEAQRAWREWA